MILFIDTTDFSKIIFGLSDGKKVQKKNYKIDPHRSHETLAELDNFLHTMRIRNPQSVIKKIRVNKGPGSYTGVRVGVTIAQALGFAWGVPVKAVAKEKFKINSQIYG